MATTTATQSLAMGPPTKSTAQTFLSSQFCTKPIRLTQVTPSTSLSGKTALITGATTGIGYHAAHHLLSLNLSHLILAVRNTEKGNTVASELRSKYPSATVTVEELEMSSSASILSFISRLKSSPTKINIAILNAAIFLQDTQLLNPFTLHNAVVQVNYINTFLLFILLLPLLRSTNPADPGRLAIISSAGVHMAKVPHRNARPFLPTFDSPESKLDPIELYFSSKSIGQLFFVKLLQTYFPTPDDAGLIVNLVDPGYCKGTGLHRDTKGIMSRVFEFSKTLTARSQVDGAWTYVDAVVSKGKESHGSFVMDWEIKPFTSLAYTEEGQDLMDALFEETMAQLEELDAGVREILEGFTRKK
ncbi:hypothetical protein QBC43DRAFT_258756 [Cladorrhinum sp. PSN259]|nr:hypothetical protein QBC43DRAFT_258756 [Cladorrhinum sp. PSN259]